MAGNLNAYVRRAIGKWLAEGRHRAAEAITVFFDPEVKFQLQFQAEDAEEADGDDDHEDAENDRPAVQPVEDGSNVVSVDFSRKK